MGASGKSEHDGCAPLGGPGCRCRAAVVRAFGGMVRSGAGYDSALAVALRVFQHHHPETSSGAKELVERWVSSDSVH